MNKTINKIVKTLILSDFFLNLGWGLLAPVFAIFILQKVAVNDIAEATRIAGFAALTYWITKSFIEIPIGYFLDKAKGEKDDFWVMFAGYFVVAVAPLGFLFATTQWHIYLLQILHAVGMAMSLPSWLAIFTRHIDKGKEAFEWSMETTSIGAGAGIAGGIGGIIASYLGFNAIFIIISILSMFSAFLLLIVRNDIFLNNRKRVLFIEEKPVVEP